MINKKRLINTFKQLVRIDSLSLHEGEVAALLKKEFGKLGIKLKEKGKVKGGEVGNLVGMLKGDGCSGPVIMLNAHIDTVSPGKGIKPLQKKGYLCTDGSTILAADNKAGVAAILELLRTLKRKKIVHPPLQIVFTVAEEIGLIGASVLPRRALKADLGLALDGGDINVIYNKAPTQINLTATIIGRAAHAGIHPEEGISAIRVASEAIAKMKLGRIDAETTANIGVIKGGKATNIIPEEVELKGEARSHNLAKLRRQIEQMKKTLILSCAKAGAKLKLSEKRMYSSFEIPPNSALISLATAAIKEVGIEPRIRQTGGGSDANIFNNLGLPTIIIGVGADGVHTTRERLNIKEFAKGTEIVLNMIKGAAAWTNSKKKR
ncbi:MAG: M20/M25/M40 family metallo-hydrolase [Candidatus Margulisbacteria bacterium]|nr:M20/M25/M40 family metallo-hydrolase [Candidatus Margulisiibacteriota bacterium]